MFTQDETRDETRAALARSGDYRLTRRSESAGRRPELATDYLLLFFQAAGAGFCGLTLTAGLLNLTATRPLFGVVLLLSCGAFVGGWQYAATGDWRAALTAGLGAPVLAGVVVLSVWPPMGAAFWTMAGLGGAFAFAAVYLTGIGWARWHSGVVLTAEEEIVAGALAASEEETRSATLHLTLEQTNGAATSWRYADLPHIASEAELARALSGRLSVAGLRDTLGITHGKAARLLAALTAQPNPLVTPGSGNQPGTLTDEGARVLAALTAR